MLWLGVRSDNNAKTWNKWNTNRLKGKRIRWIVVVVLSNTPISAGLSFGTNHRGSNSSCQQQPFTYLFSQYVLLGSIHFTSGTFVSPPLRFLYYVCARLGGYVWTRSRTHLPLRSYLFWVYSCTLALCACGREHRARIFTHTFTQSAMGARSMPEAAVVRQPGVESLWSALSADQMIIRTINSHLRDLGFSIHTHHSSLVEKWACHAYTVSHNPGGLG